VVLLMGFGFKISLLAINSIIIPVTMQLAQAMY